MAKSPATTQPNETLNALKEAAKPSVAGAPGVRGAVVSDMTPVPGESSAPRLSARKLGKKTDRLDAAQDLLLEAGQAHEAYATADIIVAQANQTSEASAGAAAAGAAASAAEAGSPAAAPAASAGGLSGVVSAVSSAFSTATSAFAGLSTVGKAAALVGGAATTAAVVNNVSGSGASASAASTTIVGVLTAGPVAPNHDLRISAYDGNGGPVPLFGATVATVNGVISQPLNRDGSFSINVGTYVGPIILRVFSSGDGHDYYDEATGETVNMGVDLQAASVIEKVGGEVKVVIHVTPLAQMVLEVLKQTQGVESFEELQLTAADVLKYNKAIAEVFGLGLVDITKILPAAVNATVAQGQSDADGLYGSMLNGQTFEVTQISELYGMALAVLSEMDKQNNGAADQTFGQLLAALNVDVSSQDALISLTDSTALSRAKVNALAADLITMAYAPTAADYVQIGVTGVTDDNILAVNQKVAALTSASIASSTIAQAVETAAQEAQTEYVNAAQAVDDWIANTSAGLTSAQLAQLGVVINAGGTNQSQQPANLTDAQRTELLALLTQLDVQNVSEVVEVWKAVQKVDAWVASSANAYKAPSVADYEALGIAVDANQLNAVNQTVAALTPGAQLLGGTDSNNANQSVASVAASAVTAYNTALQVLSSYAQNSQSAGAPTADSYAALGLGTLTAAELTFVNAAVANAEGMSAEDVAAFVQSALRVFNWMQDNSVPSAAPTAQDFMVLGLIDSALTGANTLSTLNTQIADASSFASVLTALQTAAQNDPGTAAFANLQSQVAGSATQPPSVNTFAAAGVTGVTADNLAVINGYLSSLDVADIQNTLDLQAVVNAVNRVMAANDGGTAPTLAQLQLIGLTGVTAGNLSAIQAAIAAAPDASVQTIAQLQAVVSQAAAINTIGQYDANSSSVPSLVDYTNAGVTGVTADNVSVVNAFIQSAPASATNSVAAIQTVVNAVTAVITSADAQDNNATNPTQAQYTALGVTGVDSTAKESLLGDVLDVKAATAADTVAEIQALANAVTAVIAAADGTDNNATNPTQATYTALGVTGVDSTAKESLLGDVLDVKAATAADTVAEIQALANAVTAVIAAADGNDNNAANPTQAQYAALGVTGVDSTAKETLLGDVLDVKAATAADTLAEIQALANAVTAVIAAADGNDNNAASPTQATYTALGVTGVDSASKVGLLGDVLDVKAATSADTVAEIQALADAVAAVLAGAAGATAPTLAELTRLGLVGVTYVNLALVQQAIAATADDGSELLTLSSIQALVDTVTASAATLIQAYAGSGSAPTLSDYETVGVSGLSQSNLAAINDAVAALPASSKDSVVKLQLIADAYISVLAAADGNDNNATPPTQDQYAALGVTGVDSAVKASLLGDVLDIKASTDVDTLSELQSLANAATAVFTGAAGGTLPTLSPLAELGVTGVSATNLGLVQQAIAGTADDGSQLSSLNALQSVVDSVTAPAVELIQAYTGSGSAPALSDYEMAGVSGLTSAMLPVVNDVMAALPASAKDSASEVQQIAGSYITVLTAADGVDNNTTSPTQAQYAALGITGVDNAAKESLLGDVLDVKTTADVDTLAKVQALADVVDSVIAGADGDATNNNVTTTDVQYASLGVTGLTGTASAEKVSLLSDALDANTAANVDTLAKVQVIADAVNSVITGADADATNNNVTTTAVQYAALGVTGLTGTGSAQKVSLLNDAVDAKAAADVDTLAEIQTLADVAAALIAVADGTDNSSTNLTQAQLSTLGVTGVNNDQKESLLGDVLDVKAAADVDTLVKVQALADAVISVIAGADGDATNNNVTTTAAQYAALGITGLTGTGSTQKVSLLSDALDAKAAADVDTLAEVQTLATAAAAVVSGAAGATAPTLAQLETLGVTGVTADKLTDVQSAIAATSDTGADVDTMNELQSVVTARLTALDTVAQFTSTSSTALVASDYVAAGVSGVTVGNIGLVNSAVAELAAANTDTATDIEAVVAAAQTVLAAAATGPAPTQAVLETLGITGVTPELLPIIQAMIADSADNGSGVDSIAELQAIVTAAAARSTAVATVAAYDGSSNVTLTVNDYTAAGVTGVTANNVAAVNSAVIQIASAQTDTTAEIQAVVDAYNSVLATAAGLTPRPTLAQLQLLLTSGATADNLLALQNGLVSTPDDGSQVDTLAELQSFVTSAVTSFNTQLTGITQGNGGFWLTDQNFTEIGVTDVTSNNVRSIEKTITALRGTSGAVSTASQVQDVVDAVVTILTAIGNGSAPAPTLADYTLAGFTTVNANNLAAVNANLTSSAVVNGDNFYTDMTSYVAGRVQAYTTALATISAYTGSNTAPTTTDYATMGVTGVTANNLSAINSVVATKVTADTDTTSKVQALVNAYTTVLNLADGTDNNGTAPTQSQYALLGVTGVDNANKASLLSDAIDIKSAADVDTVAEIQTLANIASKVVVRAAGNAFDPLPSQAELTALGITDLNTSRTNDFHIKLSASADDGSEVNTLAKIQAMIDVTPPALQSAETNTFNGWVVRLNFDGIKGTDLPPASAFTVMVNGTAINVTNVSAQTPLPGELFSRQLVLTLATEVTQGQSITVTYTDPTAGDDTTAVIQDLVGNDLATFTSYAVTNRLPDTIAPSIASTNNTSTSSSKTTALNSNFVFTFTENIVLGTSGTVTLARGAGNSWTAVETYTLGSASASRLSVSGTTLTVDPTALLAPESSYSLLFSAGAIKDAAGNSMAAIATNTSIPAGRTYYTVPNLITPTYFVGAASSKLGQDVSALGDINADGIDDFGLSSPGANAYYVVYGGTGFSGVALSSGTIASSAGFKITGTSGGDGISGIGDVNRDGTSDFVVTAGASAYVVYGAAGTSASTLDLTGGTIAPSLGYKITLPTLSGTGVASYKVSSLGDVNGDGQMDFALAAGTKTFVIYGKTTHTSLDISSGTVNAADGFVISGAAGMNTFGYNGVSGAGDFNGDGFADILIGSPGSLTNNTGAVWVVYGSATPSSVTLSTTSTTSSQYALIKNTSTTNYVGPYSYFGADVAGVGDVNADGKGDIVVGGVYGTSAYVILGTSNENTVTVNGANFAQNAFNNSSPGKIGYRIYTSSSSEYIRSVSGAGDFNGDGYADLLVSTENSSGPWGSAYIVYGNATSTTSSDVLLSDILSDPSKGVRIASNTGENGAFATTYAGDINNDGLGDLLIGGNSSSGSYAIVYGSQNYLSSVVAGSGSVSGTTGNEVILGSGNNDTLTGGGGTADQFKAGAGNDLIVLDQNVATGLTTYVFNSGDAQRFSQTRTYKGVSIDGGSGFDTLSFTGGVVLDLTQWQWTNPVANNFTSTMPDANTGQGDVRIDSRIESIERIDMATDTAANTLTLQARDVVDMVDFNQVNSSTAGWASGTYSLQSTSNFHQLIIDGTSNDILNIKNDTGWWLNKGNVTNGSNTYTVYQNDLTSSQMLVDNDVQVTNNDGTPEWIDLGAGNGFLINLIFVDGSFYGIWDKNGNKAFNPGFGNDGMDFTTMWQTFKQDVNGVTNPNGNETDATYRYATLNGTKVAVASLGLNSAPANSGSFPNTAIDNNPAGEANPTYDDWAAIIDAFTEGGTRPFNNSNQAFWTADRPAGNGFQQYAVDLNSSQYWLASAGSSFNGVVLKVIG